MSSYPAPSADFISARDGVLMSSLPSEIIEPTLLSRLSWITTGLEQSRERRHETMLVLLSVEPPLQRRLYRTRAARRWLLVATVR
jgi:hypothetical protein